MEFDAQSTMRHNYINGGPGVATSGVVWLVATAVGLTSGFQPSMLCFFFGGMLIHPISVLVSQMIKRDGPAPDKKLVRLSIMTLPFLFAGLFWAYATSLQNQALFYPIMAIAIGLRYLIFQRIYGLKSFVYLGLCLAVIGGVTYATQPTVFLVPLLVGMVELFFGIWLTMQKQAATA